MSSTSSAPDHRRNNFDILRLVAAIAVLFSHSFAAVGRDEPASVLDPAGSTWGHLGVLIFFSMSGYLIASSWVREPSVGPYLTKRSFRIFPALVVMNLVTVFVIGIIATSASIGTYLSHPDTWLYPVAKSLLFVPGNYDPPGIFDGNPWDGVNPSLWTLPVEFLCYLAVMVVLLVTARMPRAVVVAVSALGVAAGALVGTLGLLAGTPLGAVAAHPLVAQSATLVAAFFTGTILFVLRDRLRLNLVIAAGAAFVAAASALTPFAATVSPILIAYIVLTLALAAPTVPLGRFRGWDLSYAMYLYGFPIQQLIVYVTGTRDPIVVVLIAVVVTAGIAALSWRFVEKPALGLGRRLAAKWSAPRADKAGGRA